MAALVISYSSADRPRVEAVVTLLRAAMLDTGRDVYWDQDLRVGERWFDQIAQAIDSAPQLFVFWCSHADLSPHVRKEFLYAISRGKRIVPVLLDDTRLPAELSDIHGIDLRKAMAHPVDNYVGGVPEGAVDILATPRPQRTPREWAEYHGYALRPGHEADVIKHFERELFQT